jgi:hypothetical protein
MDIQTANLIKIPLLIKPVAMGVGTEHIFEVDKNIKVKQPAEI